MNGFKLVKLDKLSGSCCSIYTLSFFGEQKTFLDQFIDENISSFKSEIKELVTRLSAMGHKTGARVQYFKVHEGRPGDGVCALYDTENSNLRLYCIRYGSQIVVVGGGGYKPKTIRTFQEDTNFKKENYLLREVSAKITERIKNREIGFSDDGLEFTGNLEFKYEEI